MRLGAVASVSAGQSSPKDEEFSEEGVPFIKAGNLEGLKTHQYNEYKCKLVSDDIAKKKKLKLHDAGTILVAKSGMSCNSGHIYVLQEGSYVVSHLACIRPDEKIPSNFIKVFFIVTGVQSLIKDAGYPSIQLGQFENMQVPDAPYDVMKLFDDFVEQSDKSKLNKIAARWPAKAVHSDFLFSLIKNSGKQVLKVVLLNHHKITIKQDRPSHCL